MEKIERKFSYELSTRLSKPQEGNILIAFDEAGIRPKKVTFSNSIEACYIDTVYKIDGSDELNNEANCFRFSKEHIESCLVKFVDTMFGSGKVSIELLHVY